MAFMGANLRRTKTGGLIMKNSRRHILSLLLCAAMIITMSLAFTNSALAADEGPQNVDFVPQDAAQQLPDGASLTPIAIEKIDSADVYATPAVSGYSQDFNYTVNMPKKGTLFIQYTGSAGSSSCYVKVDGRYPDGSGTEGATKYNMYCIPSAGNVNLTVSVYGQGAYAGFVAYYAAGSKSFSKASKEFLLGSPASGGTSTFKVKVPATGYLKITAVDALSTYSVKLKAKNYKDWSYLSSGNNYTEYIGVKKGTYTIKLSGYPTLYSVKTSFVKVKETSAKTTKSKAAALTKKKLNKGIITVNKKKVHWYKIKNPKTQKLTLAVNAKKLSGGGSSLGKLKVTCYFPDGKSSYGNLYAGHSDQFKITYGKIGTSTARKGTYYIKVESQDGANGYYTLKWK